MSTCDHCNGSGEVAVNVFTLRYVAPGPVPDDARNVVASKCNECDGCGHICEVCEERPSTVDANADAPRELPPLWICETCQEIAWDREQERLMENAP